MVKKAKKAKKALYSTERLEIRAGDSLRDAVGCYFNVIAKHPTFAMLQVTSCHWVEHGKLWVDCSEVHRNPARVTGFFLINNQGNWETGK